LLSFFYATGLNGRTTKTATPVGFDQKFRHQQAKIIHGVATPFPVDPSCNRVTACREEALIAEGRRVAENTWGAKSEIADRIQ
jgi:hypothetical protein